MWIADFMPARDRFARVVAQYRFAASLTELEATMPLLAISELCASRTDASAEVTAEGLELTRQLDYEQDEISYVVLQAWTASLIGDEDACRLHSASAIQRGLAAGLGGAVGEAHLALGLLELGLGNAREAIHHLEQTDPGPFPPTMVLATPELIDAALRIGEPDRARLALERLEAWAPASRTALLCGMVARCRGVLASDAEEAELCFQAGPAPPRLPYPAIRARANPARLRRAFAPRPPKNPSAHPPARRARHVRGNRGDAVGRANAGRATRHRGRRPGAARPRRSTS